MKTSKNAEKINYAPPLLGNGSLSVMLDYCAREKNAGMFDDKTCCVPEICVWKAGRRYRYDTIPERPEHKRFTLIPFGMTGEIINGIENPEPYDWEQTLDTDNGFMCSKCEFDGLSISSRAYVHYDFDLLSIKKTFDSDVYYSFVYKLKGADGKKIERLYYTVRNIKNGIVISYSIDGKEMYNGEICVFSDADVKAECKDYEITLSKHFKKGESASMFVLYCDNFDCEDYSNYINKKKGEILKNPENVFEESCKKWADYMSLSYVSIGDEKISNAYKTAQYHLKTLSTKWSLPMGINNALWHGVFFAFDEIFTGTALLSSNHIFEAYKICKFRFDTLGKAIQRVSNGTVKQANYFCETMEDGCGTGVYGFWTEHIFQNVSIVLNFWEYYKYTNDIEFLKNMALPVAKHCAAFFMNNAVYTEESGKTVITACTDLERLGPSVKNAYMTTCSAIKLFEVFYEITRIVFCDDADKQFAEKCLETADALRKYLPNDGEKYLPYPGCKDKSIGVLSGCFPYKVQKNDDILQKNAIKDFVGDELTFGNMYSVGHHIAPWYAAWKATVYADLFDTEAYFSLKQATESAGCFAEMFEINEKDCVFRPWFTTAAGSFIYGVNRMLVQRDGDVLYVAPALDKSEKTFSFRLSAYGNITVEVKAENAKLTYFKITHKGENDGQNDKIKLKFPDFIDLSYALENGIIKKEDLCE